MNNQSRLSTNLIADQVKDALDDMKQQELIAPALYNKSVSFRRILNALNKADMAACRMIKQEVQMVILVPEGVEEVFLENTGSYIDPTVADSFTQNVTGETNDTNIAVNQVFLNREWFVDASNIRSQFIHAYSSFPKGNTTPAYKIKIVGQDMFDEAKMKANYNSAAWGDLSVVYFEAATKRLRFGKSFGSDMFLSFPAYLMPSKLDLAEIHDGDYEAYKIKSPTYAEDFIIYKTLEKVLPLGSQAHQYAQQLSQNETQTLYTHIPQNTAVIEVSDGYIG